jgi:hypothetical protein
MTQDLFPEIQAAVKALENQITVTESEIVKMKESISEKKKLVRGWRKAVAAVSPRAGSKKKESRTGSGFRIVLKGISRRKRDDIAGPDFLNRAAPTLRPPESRCNDQRLTEWMRVPSRSALPVRRSRRHRELAPDRRLRTADQHALFLLAGQVACGITQSQRACSCPFSPLGRGVPPRPPRPAPVAASFSACTLDGFRWSR